MATAYQEDLWSAPSYEESNKAFDLIEEGTYTFELTKWEEPVPVDPKYDDTGKKMRSKFVFTVVDDPDWEGTNVSEWMTSSMNEKSAMYPFVRALLGGTVDPALRIVPSLVEDKRLQATVIHGDPDSQNRIWPEITAPLPIRERKGRRKVEDPIADAIAETFDAAPDENLGDVPF